MVAVAGCGGQEQTDPNTQQPPETEQTAPPEISAEETETLHALLSHIATDVQPGAAGTSLRAVQVAVEMMEWSTETALTAEQAERLADEWLLQQTEEIRANFSVSVTGVKEACEQLMTEGNEELLESAGCTETEYPWTQEQGGLAMSLLETLEQK